MKVRDIMTTEVRSCGPHTNLCEAAALMLDGDCGILPVLDDGRLVGVVTDRDLFISLGTRNRLAVSCLRAHILEACAKTPFTP